MSQGKAGPELACSWSGGKESALACWRAVSAGLPVRWLVNLVSREDRRVSFHGTPGALVAAQASAAGLELVQGETTPDDYEPAFVAAVSSLKPAGLTGMVFGDLYVDEHRAWVERICREIGIEASEPLWGTHPEAALEEFLAAGFRALVVVADGKVLGEEWLGRQLDRGFAAELAQLGVDPCGEQGEFHTFVFDGPLFRRPIPFRTCGKVRRDGYWFLDIREPD